MPLLGKSQAQPHQQQQLPGVHFPDSTLTPDGHYFALPPAEQTVIGEARALFEKQQDDGPDSGWTDLGTKQGIRLSKKFEASQPNDVPWVRGVGTLPFPPQAATAIITHPAFRMFWDERLAAGHSACLISIPFSSFLATLGALGRPCASLCEGEGRAHLS